MSEVVRGRYEVLEVVGRGGQGDLVRALDTQHDRQVAMKVRKATSDAERQALLGEARVLLGLTAHPALPQVREDFFEGDLYYLVMDWIEGESLARRLEQDPDGLPVAEVVDDLRPVAGALDHLHAHDPAVIHKDVKPGNIIRRPDGGVVLVDFGLSSTRTRNGRPGVGTPGYSAPEVATDEVAAPAIDIYGLAATAFALLTGSPPSVALPSWKGVPPDRVDGVQATIRRGLSIDPARRQASATAFADGLARAAGLERKVPRSVRPRTALAAALVAAVLVGAPLAYVATASHGPSETTISVAPDSVGMVDLATLHAHDAVGAVGRPAAVASADGAIWVIEAASGDILRIDPATRSIVARIPGGNGPTGIASGGGSVWVTNQDDRSVSRIDPATNTVNQRILVGNAPTGIAFGDGTVWIANTLDDTVTRLDATTGVAQGAPIGVGQGPARIAIGLGSVWVTDEAAARVSRISPTSGAVVDTIPVGRGPLDIAVGHSAVWVANRRDRTISRIDPVSGAVTTTDIGADPIALIATGADVWVADEAGDRLLRLEGTTGGVASIVRLGSPPHALGIDGNTLFIATGSSAAAHRGGTLVIASGRVAEALDPAVYGWGDPFQLGDATTYLTSDTLVAYRHVGGSAGTTLVADLAQSIPDATDAGRTYTFHLEPGVHFSDGTEVSVADVRRSFERAYLVTYPLAGVLGPSTLIGLDGCSPEGCDLSSGIVIDDASRTVTFKLSEPDPDFLFRIAIPLFTIVPASTPDPVTTQPDEMPGPDARRIIPGTGPYRIETIDPTSSRIVLSRNPYFHVWSVDARPDGFADRIELHGGLDQAAQAKMIESGEGHALTDPLSDPTALTAVAPETAHRVLFPTTQYIFMNTTVAPFDDLRVRQAVNFALDRGTMAALIGGVDSEPTCQVLPPGIPGYEPYCPYTIDPTSGQWTAPDLTKAQQLVDVSGTGGSHVTVWTSSSDGGANEAAGREVVRTLSALGYRASLKVGVDYGPGYAGQVFDPETHAQIGLIRWGLDFAQPNDFFAPLLTCDAVQGQSNGAQLCDPDLDAMIVHAQDLQSHDRAGANVLWAAIDKAVVDVAAWAPYGNQTGVDLVSTTVGDYQYNTFLGTLYDQLWVQ